MKTFKERHADLVAEAISYISNLLRTGSYVNIGIPDPEEYNLDHLFGLPFVSYVGKHGFYDQYAIVAVKKEEGQITLYTICTGEDSEEREFLLENADAFNLFAIADELTQILK